MKYTKLTVILILILTIFFGYNKWVFSWGMFQLYNEAEYSKHRHEKIISFNPDEDTLYLPGMEDKEFFQSVNDFSIMRKKGVREFIYIYLTTGREYTIRSIERSGSYIDTINSIIKKNPDIPAEIALLPLLESGFDPMAVSRSKAVGLWQFMERTSAYVGLRTDGMVDERRNVEKSTEAAIRHLRHLYKKFGSWELALAAYNGGEGLISRAIENAGTNNIWELIKSGALPKETSEYIPRYAALMLIYKNQRLFRVEKEIEIEREQPAYELCLKEQKSLKELSEQFGTNPDEIKKMNPELKTDLTPFSDNCYPLKVPAGKNRSLIAKMIF
ncbi:MAG TPA: lytic transglycosylase domain-containing protein [Spirochaetota bacterium]|nr:lytic transglycosylase domain-containing protein [Spirochaetota bacterium]